MNQSEPPQFAEPWEAQALALANELVRTGRFTAAEWANALGAAIRRSEQESGPDDGSNYYRHVLSALESLTTGKSLLSQEMLNARKADWAQAYEHTPHGQPVMLDRSRKRADPAVAPRPRTCYEPRLHPVGERPVRQPGPNVRDH